MDLNWTPDLQDGEIDYVSSLQYEAGVRSIDWATQHVAMYVSTIFEIQQGRRINPNAFPQIPPSESENPDYWARRIVAVILDAGWRPPLIPDTQ